MSEKEREWWGDKDRVHVYQDWYNKVGKGISISWQLLVSMKRMEKGASESSR